MKADVLTSLTSPKGIGFDGTGGPTLRELTEQANWFKPGKVVGDIYVDGKVRWNLPKGDHQIRKSFWTSAECAMACKDLDQRYFYAMRFQFAMDNSAYYPLKLALLEYAIREKKLKKWPDTVPTEDGTVKYLENLTEMHLLEVCHPAIFARLDPRSPNQWRRHMRVRADIWTRKLQPIYETIGDEYRKWIAIGSSHMNRWLRSDAA